MLKLSVWQRVWRDTFGVRSADCAKWVNDSVERAWADYDKLMVWSALQDRSVWNMLEDYEWKKESYYNYYTDCNGYRWSPPHHYYNDTRDSDAIVDLLSYNGEPISWDTHTVEWSTADIVERVQKYTGITLDQHRDCWNGDHLKLGLELEVECGRAAHMALLWMIWENNIREELWATVTEAIVEVATVEPN